MKKSLITAAALAALSGAAFGQDSVPVTPGQNDAILAYDTGAQRLRYVVDLAPQVTSWGQQILVGPVIKASRDSDPLYKTLILGSSAISPTFGQAGSFSTRNFALWTGAGPGVNISYNSPPSALIPQTGFDSQFAIAASDFSLSPSDCLGAIVGRSAANFSRLYVERIVAALSRPNSGLADTATLSYGSVDALGNVFLRADNFNTLATTTSRVLGDNILRVNLATRNSGLNAVTSNGVINSAGDAASTTFIISNDPTPTNTPSSLLQTGFGPFALVFDFAGRLRTGSTVANVANLGAAHLGAGAAAHRGNPSFSPFVPLGGNAGTIATLALPTAGSRVNTLDAAALNFGAAGSPPTVAPGTARALSMTSPLVSGTGFTTNTLGNASFRQYLSQVPFRGSNGLVGVGRTPLNQLVLAATANDTAGDFIAAVTATGPVTSAWLVAAYPGQPVLNGSGGVAIGSLAALTTISAPAVDGLGNIYFVATWTPTASPQATGLFRAVNNGASYVLELILTTGQTITGINSTRPYTITSLTLADSDSLASGAFHHQNLISAQVPGSSPADQYNIRAMGGLIVNSVVTYNNGGVSEAYDTVLFVSPTSPPVCRADFNGTGGITVQDIFDYLAAYFGDDIRADFNASGGVTVQDIFDFLAAYFVGCP